MHVVPDLLPDLRPTIDLRLNFPEPPPKDVYRRSRVKRRYQKVDSGMYLLPEQVWLLCLKSDAPVHYVCCHRHGGRLRYIRLYGIPMHDSIHC